MAEVVSDTIKSIAEENDSISEKMETDENTELVETPMSENEPNGASKREREEDEAKEETLKKPRLNDEPEPVEEAKGEGQDGEEEKPTAVKLGPKEFESSEAMFNYFFKFLHFWAPNLDINKYEHMALLDLLKNGHAKPDQKIGGGIQAFQVRYHPTYKSRCFFLVRVDGTTDDFSFRKCIDQILPLPENLKPQFSSDGRRPSGGHQKGGGGRRGRDGRGQGTRGGFRK